jgi:hypothetical protein
MAGVGFRIRTDEIASGTGTKTILQIVAAANHRVVIPPRGILVSFNGISTTQLPIQVEVLKQTDAGTMGTAASTIVKANDDDGETLQTTRQDTATAEPSAGDIHHTELVHAQTAVYIEKGFIINGGDRLGIRTINTGGTDTNVTISVDGEE